MKIIFAGTPVFASKALEALLAKKHKIAAVLTQPDRPSGRGMQLLPSAVKQVAINNNIPIWQPAKLKGEEIEKQLMILGADVMVVAAYGLILPRAMLQITPKGCLNIHASLLPRWRGAAPIQRAILAGDNETGVTIMQMDEGLDTGEILLKDKCIIATDDTAATLHDKLTVLGAQLIVKVLAIQEQGLLKVTPQDERLATYAAKLNKDEAQMDWSKSAIQLEREVRGYQPFPIAHTILNGLQLKIWRARVLENLRGDPGTVIAVDKDAIIVACGQGGLALETLQRPGGKVLTCAQFVQGFPVKVGDRLT